MTIKIPLEVINDEDELIKYLKYIENFEDKRIKEMTAKGNTYTLIFEP